MKRLWIVLLIVLLAPTAFADRASYEQKLAQRRETRRSINYAAMVKRSRYDARAQLKIQDLARQGYYGRPNYYVCNQSRRNQMFQGPAPQRRYRPSSNYRTRP